MDTDLHFYEGDQGHVHPVDTCSSLHYAEIWSKPV